MDNLNKYIKVSENRYREKHGLFLEDFQVGTTIEHRPGRTITLTDNIWQSLISMNQHPIHIDKEFARNTEFKEILVSSLVTFNIVNGMTVNSMSNNVIANLGWDNVRLLNPVFVGDTLYAESEVLSVRESKSRPNQGIVIIKTTGFKQDKTIVIQFNRTFLVPKFSS
ncbi:MAG: MaoC family dehydratase [Burkholderiales bacterium]|nr:MaoC family dehydratase [Burkholderiales bacterium]